MMLYKLLSGTDRSRFESRVVSLSSDAPLAERIRNLHVPIAVLNVPPSLYGGATAIGRVVRLVHEYRPDVLQTWLYHADLIGGVAGKLLGRPVVWNIQTSTLDPSGISARTLRLVRFCATLSAWLPSAIVSCSHVGVDVHAGYGYTRSQFRVIPNGIDLGLFRPDPEARAAIRSELGIAEDTRVIGMVARLHPQKDHANFFEAASRLLHTHPGVVFVLCGLGLDTEDLQLVAKLRSLGLERHVHLLGLRSDVARIMSGLDIHTLSSSFGEGFPNVIGEAMASGVPCVVTNVGDSATIVGDTGRCVASRDPESLASAWRSLLDLTAAEFDTLRSKARSRIEAHFSLPASISEYEKLYGELART